MNRVKGLLGFAILCFGLTAQLFAVDEQLVGRYLNAADEQYNAGNYPKAFSYINIVLNSYKAVSLPENIEVIAESIYYAYLVQIKDTKNTASFNKVKEKLIEFPFLSSERINRTIKIINTHEAQDIAWGGDPSGPAAGAIPENNPALHSTLQLQLALETAKQEAEEKALAEQESIRKEILDTQKSAFESAYDKAASENAQNNRVLLLVLLVLAGVGFIVFIAVIINLVVNQRSVKTQNEKFVETLKAVAQLSRIPHGQMALEALPPLYGVEGEMRLIGSGTVDNGIPSAPETDEDKAEMVELAQKCRDLGKQIDIATGRKNNSKNVAETVFKIAQEMGKDQFESTLLFSVAMVYDIGFLEIDSGLLMAENLNEQQKFEIRNHVKQGLAQLSFVPEKYMSVFADGVLMHHENMDGSGYPEGLSGSRIPYVARVIRVAESFMALISRRSYRVIFDKESALEELRKKPGNYDSEIVDALEMII